MTQIKPLMAKSTGRIGPYSAVLNRGSIGNQIDGRTWEGRFLRSFEKQMIDHLGGDPSVAQILLIRRLARIALRLELFDKKLADGNFTDLDGRVYGALQNTYVRSLLLMGLKPEQAPGPSLQDLIAQTLQGQPEPEEPPPPSRKRVRL